MIKGLRFLATTFLIGQSYAEFISVDDFREITSQRPAKAIYDLYHISMSTEEQANGISTIDAGKYFRVFESFVQTIMDEGDRSDQEMLSGLIAYKMGGTAYETIYRMALLGYRFEKLPVKNYSQQHRSVYQPPIEDSLSDIGSIHEEKIKPVDDSSLVSPSNLTEERKSSFDENAEVTEVKVPEKLPEDLEEKIDEPLKEETEPVIPVQPNEEKRDNSVINYAKNTQAKDIKGLFEKPEFIKKMHNKKNIDAFINSLDYDRVVNLVQDNFVENNLLKNRLDPLYSTHFAKQISIKLIDLINKQKDLKSIYDKPWFKNIDKFLLPWMNEMVDNIKNKDIQEQVKAHKKGELQKYINNLKKEKRSMSTAKDDRSQSTAKGVRGKSKGKR
jgi:hypothetical protein